jgi:hypothetical protein
MIDLDTLAAALVLVGCVCALLIVHDQITKDD